MKNIQLKKFEKLEETKENKPAQPRKSEFVVEESSGVAKLRSMFEGPAARQKAMQQSMSKVE